MGVVDTGTSLLAGPTAEVKAVAKQLGAVPLPGNNAEFMIDCKKVPSLPTLTFAMPGGDRYELTGSEYTLNVEGECLLGIIGLDVPRAGPLWILGDVFLRKWYSVFDYDNLRVGFASAVH